MVRKMTESNLRSAFAGESQARMRYTIYAERAQQSGFPNVARLFNAVAFSEKVHATNHYRNILSKGGVTTVFEAVFGSRNTAEDLQAGIEGETFEITEMHPAYKAVAQAQGEKAAEIAFAWALESEKMHLALYQRAQQAVDQGKEAVFNSSLRGLRLHGGRRGSGEMSSLKSHKGPVQNLLAEVFSINSSPKINESGGIELVSGVKMGERGSSGRVLPYDGEAPKIFEDIKQFLCGLIPFEVEVEHVGSTAVPALPGKGIIDTLIVTRQERMWDIVKLLESKGFRFNPEGGTPPERLFVSGPYRYGGRELHIHLHITFHGSKEHEDKLLFKDYLRRHPEEARRYYELKRQWDIEAGSDDSKYGDLKTPYINEVLEKARKERLQG